jgi:hypothetical protein
MNITAKTKATEMLQPPVAATGIPAAVKILVATIAETAVAVSEKA